ARWASPTGVVAILERLPASPFYGGGIHNAKRQKVRGGGCQRRGIHNAKNKKLRKTANLHCWGIHHTRKVPFPCHCRPGGGPTSKTETSYCRRLTRKPFERSNGSRGASSMTALKKPACRKQKAEQSL